MFSIDVNFTSYAVIDMSVQMDDRLNANSLSSTFDLKE